jgi:CRP-like cAMP-binding protein
MATDTKTLKETIRGSRLFSGFTDAETDFVLSEIRPTRLTFKKNACICEQGEATPYIDILEQGSIVSQKLHIDGRLQLVQSFLPPAIVNLESVVSVKGTSPVFVVANTQSRIVRFRYDAFIRNRNIPESIRLKMSVNIISYIADDNIRFMNKSDVLSRRKVSDRIIIFLSIIRERTKNDIVDIGMNQEEFALYLCVDRSTLCEALNKLRKDGLIEFKGSRYTLKFPKIGERR